MRPRLLLALPLALVAASCGKGEPEPDAEPAASPTATATGEKVSILREEVAAEREAPPPMTPLALTIPFEEGTDLTSSAIEVLRPVLGSPQLEAGGAITIGGHSDSGGADAANLTVSRRRAEAVRDWLIENEVDEDRITIIAFGEQNPVAPNASSDGSPSEAGRRKNRRAELAIAVPPGTPSAASATPTGTLVDEIADASED